MDWGQAIAIIGGQKMTLHLFAMVLSAPGAPFLMAFPNEKQEAFLEGLNKLLCSSAVSHKLSRTITYVPL
jgi:hypothetical protein